MSRTRAATASNHTSPGARGPVQTLREAMRILWSVGDRFTKRRLLLALALVACGALLAAGTPIALKLAVDSLANSLAQGVQGSGGPIYAVSLGFLGLYVVGQYLTRAFAELRVFLYGVSEQRVRRHVGPRLFEPDCGRILLDGVPINDLSLSAVRQAIAVVPQDTVLFNDTIANNIGFGRAGSSMAEIHEAARIANLHEFIQSTPDKYETIVGERGLKLSGGERQRIAIARAALKQPRIFVFDEATSSLDTKTEREILRNLLDVSARSTTLVIAHRLSTVVHADEIVVLDRGAIIERGTHDVLRKLDGAYAALWRAQLSGMPEREELPKPVVQG